MTGDGGGAMGPRALIVKFGSIGDVIMAIPGAAALHAGGLGIDWVVSEAIAPLLALYPWIHVVPVDEARLLRGAMPERLREAGTLVRRLRARVQALGAPYEQIATMYFDPRYHWLTRAVPARRRVALVRGDRRYDLLAGRHHADEYARILTGRPDGVNPTQMAPVRPPGLEAQAPLERPTVVLFPAGARNVLRDDALRRWPIRLYVDLARSLLREGPCEVVLAGGEGDRWAMEAFAPLLGAEGAGRCRSVIGQTTLVETLQLLDAADVTVTHDTGPLHLAGLTATGIVTVFGPTDPHGRLPWRVGSVALWGGEGFSCRPCYDGRDYAPCSDNRCMAQVTPEDVLREVQRLLAARAKGVALPPRVVLPTPAGFVPAGSLMGKGE